MDLRRARLMRQVVGALDDSPIVALIGPRQCGKTTLARHIVRRERAEVFDLEDPVDLRRLESPKTALEPLEGLVVIDEVQRMPNLFPLLRVLADRPKHPARFLLLGSASPDLVRGSSESLAGRITYVPMGGFDLDEVGHPEIRKLWLRGGFPRSFLAKDDAASLRWRTQFIDTFLERDLRNLGFDIPPVALRRLWMMLAHHHGGILNASELASSLGTSHTTVRRHLDLLAGALVVRQLPPWFENVAKRQVKSPKIYVRDSGLLHGLLGIPTFGALEGHPKLGASWEGFVLEETLRFVDEREAFFWATPSGPELDLLIVRGSRRIGIEVKHSDAPSLTRSMHTAREVLSLDQLYVVFPGTRGYALDDTARVVTLPELRTRLAKGA
jgi:predicted AAA+ superfamily ATPase